jgi:hypothetical protein
MRIDWRHHGADIEEALRAANRFNDLRGGAVKRKSQTKTCNGLD